MSIWGKILDNKLTRLAEKSVLHSAYRRSHDEVALERAMRSRDAISVEFLINSLSAWKTEKLYEAMAAHPRFRPSISIPPSLDEADTRALRQYLTAKGYKFRDMAAGDKINADIAFYQKPYAIFTERGGYAYWRNAETLTCYIDYAFHTTETKWGLNLPFLNEAWMVFYENQTCVDGAAKIMDNGARNSVVTGLPVQDELMAGAEGEADPWKPQPTVKKRVIYAPHHSIEDDGGLNFSTFMEMGEDMLKIAEQHADTMQFAFKPHPLLRPKLEKAWGRERTDEYYSKWAELPNCQMEEGKYNALFMKSDALIHDCSSFIVEYHYTRKPALYLVKEGRHGEALSDFGRQAYDLHYKARTADDVEKFLEEVVARGSDPMRTERERFYAEQLTPPGGRTACENIISAILGE